MRISFTALLTLVLCKWKIDGDNRTAAGFGMYRAFASQVRHPFFDSEKAETFRLFDIETLAIVPDGQCEAARLLQYLDAYGGRMRMPRTIVQRFLHDTVNACFVFVRQIIRYEVR